MYEQAKWDGIADERMDTFQKVFKIGQHELVINVNPFLKHDVYWFQRVVVMLFNTATTTFSYLRRQISSFFCLKTWLIKTWSFDKVNTTWPTKKLC